MGSHIWIRSDGILRLLDFGGQVNTTAYSYFDEGSDILQAKVEKTGIFSKLKNYFVLGKVNFWEREGCKHRIPFVRVNNHSTYPNGAIMTPNSWISVRYHRHGKTIDETTPLSRIELLHASDEDFVRRVFETYYCDPLVPKNSEKERHFLLYSNERDLVRGKII